VHPCRGQPAVVTESSFTPESEVREKFKRVKPLKGLSISQRGWTLNVLNLVRRLVGSRGRRNESKAGESESNQGLLTSSPTNEFTNEDV
jgi:hypothetical protein